MHTKDDLHRALGEFLTVSARVENGMFVPIWICEGKDLEIIFEKFSQKTFGCKIKHFKRAIKNYSFDALHRRELEGITPMLDELLPTRNNLIHGETYEFGSGGELPVPYRIGVTKKDFDYLNKAFADKSSPHTFDVPRIEKACELCREIYERLAKINHKLLAAMIETTKRRNASS